MKIWSAGEKCYVSDLNANFNDVARSLFLPLVLGENINAGEAVIVGGAVNFVGASYAGSYDSQLGLSSSQWAGQVFVTSNGAKYIKSVTLKVQTGNSDPTTYAVSIRAVSGGVPTGADINGEVKTASTASSAETNLVFTFDNPIPVLPNTEYAVCARHSSGGSSPRLTGDTTSPGYVNGTAVTSANSGSTWSSIAADCSFTITEAKTEIGKVYKANASVNDEFANNFIGFMGESGVIGESKYVILSGLIGALSGLTAGYTYYLSNTSGAIATSAGSQSRKIGLAISATQLLIKHDNA